MQRIIGLLTDERNPCDVDELLVVTFSRASAAEMKARISEALGELCRARPEDARLKRQLFRLGGASIGTIHSFCLDLLRENFEALDLPPDFRVAEENEAAALRAVSYTHLQGAGGLQPDAGVPHAAVVHRHALPVPAADHFVRHGNRPDGAAVSYTHLDVYKRQDHCPRHKGNLRKSGPAVTAPCAGKTAGYRKIKSTAKENPCLLYTSRCV